MPDLALYRPAEAWVAENRERLEREFPGQYLYMNARTLQYIIAPTHSDAANKHYGPVPFEGFAILGITLK